MPVNPVKVSIVHQNGHPLGQFYLGEGEHFIGRDENCAVMVPSDYVSRNHARLVISDSGIYIEDAGSSSGTLVDGARISGAILIQPTQRINLGDVFISLEQQPEEKYFASRQGQQFGPYTRGEIQTYLNDGTLAATDKACVEGGSTWIPITSITQASSPAASPPRQRTRTRDKRESWIKKFLFIFLARGQHEDEGIVAIMLDNIGRIATLIGIISLMSAGVYWYNDYAKKAHLGKKSSSLSKVRQDFCWILPRGETPKVA